MASYEEIHGKRVETFSSDPTLDSSYEGQVWFNSTSGILKTVVTTDAWFSQAPTTSQHGDGGGCGTASATLIWGGYSPDNPPVTNATEEFDGTGWAAGGNYGSSLFRTGGAGPQTAALGVAGRTGGGSAANQDDCYKYDGSSWTSTANYPANKNGVGVTGTQTAAIAVGGAPYVDTSFEFDGSSWTSSGTYPVSRGNIRGAGTQTAGIFAGGYDPYSNVATTYNGSTFTAIPSINTARGIVNHSGNSGSSVISSGAIPASPYVSNATERWDGSSWTTSPATLTSGGIGGGTGGMSNPAGNTSALLAALRGPPSSYPTNTEEYATSISTTTPAAFSSGNAQNLSSYNRSGWGTQNAAWVAGGGFPSDKNESEEYDGTTWTEGNNLNTARGSAAVGGPQTAAIFATGSRTTNVEYYDGTNWTNQTASPQARSSAAGGGTQTSFVLAGGTTAGSPYYPISSTGEEWNGSSWTSAGALPAPQGSMNGSALGESESAVMLAGGAISPAGSPGYVPHTVTNISLDYGGTSWTANPNIITARVSPYFFGTTSLGILAGGDTANDGSKTTISEQWNGSVFVTGVNMATARYTGGRAGTATAGLVAGGYPGTSTPSGSATEEYTGETTTISAATLTTG